jgi:Fe2+ or Zn2+ uptake regulation protein
MKVLNTQDKRLTKQRKVVLEVVRATREHLTASEVFTRSKHLLEGISFATVYNSLKYLKELGCIAEIQFGNGASRFDGLTSRHDHAICTSCGRLVDIELEHPEEIMMRAAKMSRFVPSHIEFTLKGICPDCVKDQR